MRANQLTKNYDCLTPEERFRLILAASGRGDEVERDRLVRTGNRITVSVLDHTPYAHAFFELELLTFLEVVEDASRYMDALTRFKNAVERGDGEGSQRSADGSKAGDDAAEQAENEKSHAEVKSCEMPARADNADSPAGQRYLAQARIAGYVLQAKVDGWKLFCEEMDVPPFLTWEGFPGFDRLQGRLELAKKVAFGREEFLCWLNAGRPSGSPELTAVLLTADAVAAATKDAFCLRVRWWS